MRGRKPKPTELKLLDGNAGRRPINPDEPRPDPVDTGTLPPAPRRLGKTGRAEWRAQVEVLSGSRVLTVSDLTALEQLCAAVEELAQLRAWLQREMRRPLKTRALDVVKWLHSAIDRKSTLAVKYEAEFGLTPSSRTRVKTEKSPGIKDKLKAFQQARRQL